MLDKDQFIKHLYEMNCDERDYLMESHFETAESYYRANAKFVDDLWNEYVKTGQYPLFS